MFSSSIISAWFMINAGDAYDGFSDEVLEEAKLMAELMLVELDSVDSSLESLDVLFFLVPDSIWHREETYLRKSMAIEEIGRVVLSDRTRF